MSKDELVCPIACPPQLSSGLLLLWRKQRVIANLPLGRVSV